MSERESGLKDYVYSPDLKNRSLEGQEGAFNTIASFLVGPVRLLLRVVHNIFILPSDMLLEYANGVFLVGVVMLAVGVFDYIAYRRWPLMVSQVIVLFIAFWMRKRAVSGIEAAKAKREVELDTAQVEEFCDQIYGELNTIIGKDLE